MRAQFSHETLHHFLALQDKDLWWGRRKEVVQGSHLPMSIVYPPSKRVKVEHAQSVVQ